MMTIKRQLFWLRLIIPIVRSFFELMCMLTALQQILQGDTLEAALWFMVGLLSSIAGKIEALRSPEADEAR